MRLIGVADAAAELGVSQRRVRQMLADGTLRGSRIGRVWAIDRAALDLVADRSTSAGRPWKAASAWAVLALANGREIEGSAVGRSRARRRLAGGLLPLAERLRARATTRRFYGHPSVLDRLPGPARAVRTGLSATGEHRLDLIAIGGYEAYMPESDIAEVARRFALIEGAERPNIVLRAIEDDAWPFRPDEEVAPIPVVALDLLDANDDRSKRLAVSLLSQP